MTFPFPTVPGTVKGYSAANTQGPGQPSLFPVDISVEWAVPANTKVQFVITKDGTEYSPTGDAFSLPVAMKLGIGFDLGNGGILLAKV